MQFLKKESSTLLSGCIASMWDLRVESCLMWCRKRSRFLPSEKRSVQRCEDLIGHCHETVISADPQRPVTREMMEDFLVWTEFPNPARCSVMPHNKADYFTQDQYRLSFMYKGLRLIAALDAGELQA